MKKRNSFELQFCFKELIHRLGAGIALGAVLTAQAGSAQGFGGLQGVLENALNSTGTQLNKELKLEDPTEDEEEEDDRPRLLSEEELTLTPPDVPAPDLDLTLRQLPPDPNAIDPIFECRVDCGGPPPAANDPPKDKILFPIEDGVDGYIGVKPPVPPKEVSGGIIVDLN